jgi:hypothetical protein
MTPRTTQEQIHRSRERGFGDIVAIWPRGTVASDASLPTMTLEMKLEDKVQLVFTATVSYCIAPREDDSSRINLDKGILAATLADVVKHATVVSHTQEGKLSESLCIKQGEVLDLL